MRVKDFLRNGTKRSRKRRGRPRAYVPEVALARATEAFWDGGLCGDVARRSGRGDRHEPAEPLRRVRRQARALPQDADRTIATPVAAAMAEALAVTGRCVRRLRRVYAAALDLYFPPRGEPRGCFLIGTATTEAMRDDGRARHFGATLCAISTRHSKRDFGAPRRGELPRGGRPAELGACSRARRCIRWRSAPRRRVASRARCTGRRRDRADLRTGPQPLIAAGRSTACAGLM